MKPNKHVGKWWPRSPLDGDRNNPVGTSSRDYISKQKESWPKRSLPSIKPLPFPFYWTGRQNALKPNPDECICCVSLILMIGHNCTRMSALGRSLDTPLPLQFISKAWSSRASSSHCRSSSLQPRRDRVSSR